MVTGETLEDKLREKLQNGEITQEEFDSLYKKFQNLGILSETSAKDHAHSKFSSSGLNQIEPGKIDGPVNIFGKTTVDGDLECRRLSISGSTDIKGDLTVTGKTSITGNVTIYGKSYFGDKLAVSGSFQAHNNLYTIATTSVAGTLDINGDYITEGQSLITGKLKAKNLKSTNKIKISAVVDISEDIICDELEIQSGKIYIGNNIKGRIVRLFPHTMHDTSKSSLDKQNDSLSGLITNVITNVVPPVIDSIIGAFNPQEMKLQVAGNIEGNDLYISNCIVSGNIIGDKIVIGPNVKLDGKIRYKDSLQVDNDKNYKIEKWNDNE